MGVAVTRDIIDQAKDILQESAAHPWPVVFLSVSGSHHYGFSSKDSDLDLRGAHLLSLERVLGLKGGGETVEIDYLDTFPPLDLVTHDLKKVAEPLLRNNGNVLEQVCSPLVVATGPVYYELRELLPGLLTRHHSHHYLGMARNSWERAEKTGEVKPLLYAFRALLTGTHLMETGEVEANLVTLNESLRAGFIGELTEIKTRGSEKEALPPPGPTSYRADFKRLEQRLREARELTHLPERPSAREALSDLLVRARTGLV